MIAVIARINVRSGQEPVFEQLINGLAAQVRAKEPACKHYQLCKGPNAGEYVMIERYTNTEAFAVHGKTPYFTAAMPAIGALLSGQPLIEVFTEVD